MSISTATNAATWDDFLLHQPASPFLQSWTMGEVYRDIGQEPVRLEVRDDHRLTGICFGHIVPARRGRHLAIPYGPVLESMNALPELMTELGKIAKEAGCGFVRMSPFSRMDNGQWTMDNKTMPSPLHLLAEHLWYLPLTKQDRWASLSTTNDTLRTSPEERVTEEQLLSEMRSTTRNLIRRAQKEGVTIEASTDPVADLQHFITLHDETRKRHGFTPYTNAFFRAQVARFAPRKECTLYLARYQEQIIAASIHMHVGGETSYHHGASTHQFSKIPASYLLQWTAVTDALKRGDSIYNFWGTAPLIPDGNPSLQATSYKLQANRHPFAGVSLFKTGFGGKPLHLVHCMDIPLHPSYYATRAFETVRKWKRGF